MRHFIIIGFLLAAVAASGQIYIDSYRFGAAQLLLDKYPSAAAAYSLRLLREGYTGSAIMVQRSSNGDSLDIGFLNGYLDTAAIKTFCGTGGTDDCRVKTWYDQSGNNYHMRHTSVTTNNVLIMDNGKIQYNGGQPGVRFFSGLQGLVNSNLVYTTNTLFATAVAAYGSGVLSFAPIFSQNTGAGGIGRSTIFQVDDSTPKKISYFFNNGTSYTNTSTATATQDAQTLFTSYSFSDNYYTAINGGSATNTVSGQSFTPASTNGAGLGILPGLLYAWTGYIQEVIIWNSDRSSDRAAIETNTNNFYSIY